MDTLTQSHGQWWSTDDAPSTTALPIPHGSEALAAYPAHVDAWQTMLTYGAPVCPVLVGDLSTTRREVRLVCPWYATHAVLYVRGTGAGNVYARERTSGAAMTYETGVLVQGKGGSTALADAGTATGGQVADDAAGSVVVRLVKLPTSAPFAFVDMELWRDSGFTVLSVSIRWTRPEEALP